MVAILVPRLTGIEYVVLSMLFYTDPRPLHIQSPFLQLYDAPVTLNASCLVSEERCYGEFADCSSIAAVYCEGEVSLYNIHSRFGRFLTWLRFAFLLYMHAALEPCSDPEAIRLTHTQSDIPGRLEVCSGGRWGTVCGIGVTNALADVVCRQLNHAADGTHSRHTLSSVRNIVFVRLLGICMRSGPRASPTWLAGPAVHAHVN